MCGFADALSVAPRPYHLRRDDAYFVVFCFAKAEDAEALAKHSSAKYIGLGAEECGRKQGNA